MKSLFTGAVLAAGLLALTGPAAAATGDRPLDAFDRLSFALPGTLTLERGGSHQVTIDADPEDLPHIDTRVSGGELHITWDDGSFGRSRGPSGPIALHLVTPELRAVAIAGSGDVVGSEWQAEQFEVSINGSGSLHLQQLAADETDIALNGSGRVRVDGLDAGQLRVKLSGSGDVRLAGAADQQHIDVLGSGDVQAEDLEGATVDVTVTGSGDAAVWATETLAAKAIGSGDIRYRGSPRVERQEHGSGRVKPI